MGGLYILNVYHRGTKYEEVLDANGSNIDWSLWSDLFSVKINPERYGVSSDGHYSKKVDYDECIYLIKHTDKTVKVLVDLLQQMNKTAYDQAINAVTQSINKQLSKDK